KPGRKIGELEILFVKYDDKIIQEQIDRLLKKSNRDEAPKVSIDEFKKFDLRVAEIIEAVPLEKSKKLLKLKVRVGETEKQILAGIKPYYDPAALKGRKIIIINNLEPATLMGEKSEGMMLAASDEGHTKVIFLTPESDIESGSKIS
ncbi:MAG: methionine--tRNA ligase subunit beta, partial [Brevinematales bacterium]